MPDEYDALFDENPPTRRRLRDPLDLIAHYESGGRNIRQQVVPPGGGYNPSVGRVTGPSTAQGPWQITNSTWRKRAPNAGVDVRQYPTAMSAPVEVQRAVAAKMFEETGYRDWAPYNAGLRAALRRGEGGGDGGDGESGEGGGTQQRTQPSSPYDALFDSPSGQTPPASERRTQTIPQSSNPPVSPTQPPLPSVPLRSRQGGGIFSRPEVQQAVRRPAQSLDPLLHQLGRINDISDPGVPSGAGELRRIEGRERRGAAGTGSGEFRQTTRGDEARTERLLQLQREETARATGSRTLRYMGTSPGREAARAARVAAERLSAEEADITRRQRLEPEVSRLTDEYRKQIREAQNRGIGPEQWLNETAAKGVAGLLELGSGVIRGAQLNPLAMGAESTADQIAAHAEALQRAAEAEGADRNYISQATQNILAGTVSTAPEMVATSLGVPAPIAFGAGGATRSVGRGEQPEQVAKSGLHGAATGAVFEIPGAVGIRNPLAKVGTIGVGTGVVEAASGQPLSKAVEAGVTNALLAGAGEVAARRSRPKQAPTPRNKAVYEEGKDFYLDELRENSIISVPEYTRLAREKGATEQEVQAAVEARTRLVEPDVETARLRGEREPQTQTKPPVEAQRAEVERQPAMPTTEEAVRLGSERGQETATPARSNDATVQETQPARFYHRDFGEVTESPNQSGIGRKKVRVIDESGAEHVIKRAAMTGRGNERAVPVRETPVERVEEVRVEGESPVREPTPLEALRRVGDLGDQADAAYIAIASERPGTPSYTEAQKRFETSVADLRQAKAALVSEWKARGSVSGRELLESADKRLRSEYEDYNIKPDDVFELQDVKLSELKLQGEPMGLVGEPGSSPSITPGPIVLSAKRDIIDGTHRVKEAFGRGEETIEAWVPRGAKSDTGTPGSKVVEPQRPSVTESVTEPLPSSMTAAKRESMSADRAALDLPELPPAERKSWQRSLDEAQPERASLLADEVLARPRALNDTETASLVVRTQQIKNEHRAKLQEIDSTADSDTLQRQRAELTALEAEFDKLSTATKASGTEKGRALAAQKLTINQDFDLVSVVGGLKAAKGRELTPKERSQAEEWVKRDQDLTARLSEAEQRGYERALQEQIEKNQRRRQRAETKADLDAEALVIRENIAAELARLRSGQFQGSGLGALDPEGKLTKELLRYAHNRIKANIGLKASELIDEAYSLVRDIGATRRQVAEALSGYGRIPEDRRSDVAKRLATLRTELKNELKAEDITAGRLTAQRQGPPKTRDPQRQRELQQQIASLEARLQAGDFSDAPKRQPPVYTREVVELQRQRDRVRAEYEHAKHRARLGPWGYALNTLSALRKSWILSGLSTQAKNIGGTGGYQVFDEVSRLPAAIVDAAVAPLTGHRSVSGPSPVAMLDSVLHAVRVGGREAAEILRTGATREQLERHQFSEINTGVKLVDYTSNLVFRFMSASDRVFYQQAYRRNLTDRASVQARNEGRGQERARELVENPPEELDAAAKHDALVNTFNNDNRLSDAIRAARGRMSPTANFALDMVMPFDRTPTNVIARIAEASPLGAGRATYGLAKAAINNSLTQEQQRQFSRTMGRAVTGTALIGLGWTLADSLFDVEDYQVFLKLGGQRINLNSISPAGNFLALGARLRENYNEGSKLEAAKTLMRVPLDQPLIRAGTEIGEVVRDPERSATRSAARLSSGFIPFSGALRDVAQVTDREERRSARTFTQQIQQNVPVLRQRLPLGAERPKTRAERLARKLFHKSLPDLSGREFDVERSQKATDLRVRARRGEDVSAALQAAPLLSRQQEEMVTRATTRTRLEEDFNELSTEDAITVYGVASPAERELLRPILARKADNLGNLPEDRQRKLLEKLRGFGIDVRPRLRSNRPRLTSTRPSLTR